MKEWYVYFVQTQRGSNYCGITKNVSRRIHEHESGFGAKCLRGRGPLKLLFFSKAPMTHSQALKIEDMVKRCKAHEKLAVLREKCNAIEKKEKQDELQAGRLKRSSHIYD